MKKLFTMLMLAVMSFGALTTYALPQTKKDGTADKRYKANKADKTKLKKDGTPDKRYKAAKPAAAPAKKKA
ncbi:hypothetical protein [Mucilaginibacter lappiensis]|uniref:Pentapeptide MXKDX repeat protein n=1 Tax=Mucilaginibacter lappiensis TaxID=354630 RepID=A0A841JGP7_9SPHI|nr:hypothetical protein [Mucilaginibacter lappiensis]MBB6108086.1 hypothetical protein [Mucilaginibacter lappiensis]MBB6129704.1 hypothetical protein [Mucilaginibacter lappiensis]